MKDLDKVVMSVFCRSLAKIHGFSQKYSYWASFGGHFGIIPNLIKFVVWTQLN